MKTKKTRKDTLVVGKDDVLLLRFTDVPTEKLEAFRKSFYKRHPKLGKRTVIICCPDDMLDVTVIKNAMKGKK